jgi:hypothetical protein
LVKTKEHQERMKKIFDNRVKERIVFVGDLVLESNAKRDAKGKHGKFDNICMGYF